MEGGPPIFRQDCTCPALLEDPATGFPYGAVTRSGPPFQALPVPCDKATGLFRVRSPLLAESRLMSVPPATEMFQFAGFASCTYGFSTGYPCGWVAPFGDPGITDRSHLPRAFRSVPRPSSPLSAKASTRCPYLRLKLMNTAAHRGKTPLPAFARGAAPAKAGAHNIRRPHMKTLLQTHPARLRRACPPRSHDKLSLHPSISTPPGFPGGISTASPNVARHRCGSPVVEVPDGGGERDRTDDLLLAKQALSQLSYTPVSGIRKQASGIRSSDP